MTAELPSKYDQLNKLWSDIEIRLRSLNLPEPIYVSWTQENEENDDEMIHLGFFRRGSCWQLHVRTSLKTDGNTDDWKSLLSCSLKLKVSATQHIDRLWNMAANMQDTTSQEIEKAIGRLQKTLARF